MFPTLDGPICLWPRFMLTSDQPFHAAVPWTTCHCTVDYLSVYRGLLVAVLCTTCHCTVDYLSRFAAKLVYLFLKFCVLKFCNRQTNGRTDERTDIMSVLAEAVELERQTAGFPLLT